MLSDEGKEAGAKTDKWNVKLLLFVVFRAYKSLDNHVQHIPIILTFGVRKTVLVFCCTNSECLVYKKNGKDY